MKTMHKALTAISLAMLCGSAYAIPVVDTVAPILAVPVTTSSPYATTHDITDNGFSLGSKVDSAILSILLSDKSGNENYSILIGDGSQYENYTKNISASGELISLALDQHSLDDLALDGRLDVRLQASSGDYQFVSSTLTAQITPVPEPGMLAMLVPGLIMVGAMKRRSRQA